MPKGMVGGFGVDSSMPMNNYDMQDGYDMDEMDEFENTAPIPRRPLPSQPAPSTNFVPRQKPKTEFSMPTFMKRDKND